ncbi:hypothetical protein FBEOM_7394 [Fusarium beomiforme]|uniref:Uncharacterized protein n=1 Tax=Fusarium beomiforme TaxID=44412 RepID=A0A9P5AHA9_9HYPO|nr:hypothetical protein FBEOM_7394 [Fusarium beomiforme]
MDLLDYYFDDVGFDDFLFGAGKDFYNDPMNFPFSEVWESEYTKPTGLVEQEPGYHRACVAVAGAVDDVFLSHDSIDSSILQVTSPYGNVFIEPLPSFETSRLRRLKAMFAHELNISIRGRLPLEICENIGRYCLKEVATRLFTEAWLDRTAFGPRDAAFRVTKSHSIWAQHVEYEGLRYVKSLSTSRRNESDTNIFEAESGVRLNIYFAEDCLGIRKVIITQDDNPPSLIHDEGLRWVVNRRQRLPFWFKAKSDTKKQPADDPQSRWAVLPSDSDLYQLAPKFALSLKEVVIHAVDWNTPGCRGYSIVVEHLSICKIIPNILGESSSQFVDVKNHHMGACFYIPIDPDERVSELWLREDEFSTNTTLVYQSLVILTNKGRSFGLGSYLRSHSVKMEQKSSYKLGFEQATTWDQRKIELPLGKPSNPTSYKGDLQFLLSSAKLEEVSTIRVCRTYKQPADGGIGGILFTYADGRQRCIGQIRLDRMEAPMVVATGKIWLRCSEHNLEPLADGFWPPTKKINWVGVDEPLDGTRDYFEVPLKGVLEWRGELHYTSIRYHESNELQERMDEVLAREDVSGGAAPKVLKTFSVSAGLTQIRA